MKSLKDPLIFITSNKNKLAEFQQMLGTPLTNQDIDLIEIQSDDIKQIVADKLKSAYSIVKKPLFIEDTSLYFEAWNNLPGPLIKHFTNNLTLSQLAQSLSGFENKNATALCAIGYHDGTNSHYFEGTIKGKICAPIGENGFGWDKIFIPNGHELSFAQLDKSEKNEFSMRRLAIEKFKIHLFK